LPAAAVPPLLGCVCRSPRNKKHYQGAKLPSDAKLAASTPVLTDTTVPCQILGKHMTPKGKCGHLVVLKGNLQLVWEDTGVIHDADPEHPVLMQTVRWLDCYFQGAIPTDYPPFVLSSTPFRIEVWKILQTIPYGETRTYGQLAEQIARQRDIPHISAQAIGGAVSRNPISILIPCHRVIGADHSLTGYDGGLDKKEGLLKLEGILPHTYSCF
jgi:methylated-DNA-[protein]-cysteine S-methyltransferase